MGRWKVRFAVALLTPALGITAVGAEPAPPTRHDGGPQATERELDAAIRRRFWRVQGEARLEPSPAREAFAWWSRVTGIPLVINWDALGNEGLDPDTPVSLDLKQVTARQVLLLITQAASPDQDMVYERTPWFVEVITKRQADRRLVTRVYDVLDLLHDTSRVEDSAGASNGSGGASNGGSGRGGGGGGSSNESRSGTGSGSSRSAGGASGNGAASQEERAEEIAALIRGAVEPDVWVENGGQSSIRHFQGRFIIRAPLYVHGQIGTPVAEWPQAVIRHRPPATQPAGALPATRPR